MKTMKREGVLISSSSDIDLLKGLPWTDVMIGKITDESLATLAYEKSECLQKEFVNAGSFVSYWRALLEGRAKIVRG